MAYIHKIKIFRPFPVDGKPWILDLRTYDIPETIIACICSAYKSAPNLVAVTLSRMGGFKMILEAEKIAQKLNIRILWWIGPIDSSEFISDAFKKGIYQYSKIPFK